jgi:hypothetical protein
MGADIGWRAGRQFLTQIQHRHVVADVEDQVGMVFKSGG